MRRQGVFILKKSDCCQLWAPLALKILFVEETQQRSTVDDPSKSFHLNKPIWSH